MPTPREHKTVQARILPYAEAIHLCQGYGGQVGWTVVSREEAERRRGFDPKVPPADRARNRSLFFDDLLEANPPSPRLLRTSRHLHTDIHSNRAFRFSFIALCSPYDQNYHSS